MNKVQKDVSLARAKAEAGATVLRGHEIEPVFTATGLLNRASRVELNRLGYYWFPSQRAWCYRPDLGDSTNDS